MNTVTVTQLTKYLRSYLMSDSRLKNIAVSGEISNLSDLRRYPNAYFTLKDSGAQIKCMMFRQNKERLKFTPENTMKVVCVGYIDIYEPDGVYQLRVQDIIPLGIGDLALAYQQMMEKLEKEGLFRAEYKKPLPPYPKKIGIATSSGGAVIHDMINTLEARYPLAEVIFVPTAVQGDEAIADIVSSVEYLDSRGDIDVIIIGRGGGSLENLWAFNTEEVARAVFRCKTPIISAVGHETDHTVSDEVADCRALTPTAAAVIATPDINEEREHINAAYEKMKQSLTALISREENRINNYAEHSPLANINTFFDERIELMNEQKKKLLKSIELLVQRREQSLLASVRELNALSPLAVLSRGYSLTKNENGIVSSTDDVKINDTLEIMVADGRIIATANEVIKDEH